MLSTKEVRSMFQYNAGILIWKTRPALCINIGDIAGSIHGGTGYCRIVIGGKQYSRSKLVWLYHGNDIIKGMVIDHINGNRGDDRIENLQMITYSENSMKKKTMKTNLSGTCGVIYRPINNNWQAYITASGRNISLGCYRTINEAIEARRLGEDKYFGKHKPVNSRGIAYA